VSYDEGAPMSKLEDQANLYATLPLREPNERYVRLMECEHYSQAQAAIDRLSDRGFEVHRTAIVGEGLHLYEQVTGRLDWFKASFEGAINGMGTGLLIGLLFAVFAPMDGPSVLNVILLALAFGAGIGILLRLISYLAMGGRRDFTSVGSLRASKFSVMCDADYADKARELLV
jgi:hypothetical protein